MVLLALGFRPETNEELLVDILLPPICTRLNMLILTRFMNAAARIKAGGQIGFGVDCTRREEVRK